MWLYFVNTVLKNNFKITFVPLCTVGIVVSNNNSIGISESRHSRKTEGSSCTVYIRTVSSYLLLSARLNWFKLVQGPFGQSNMHRTLDVCPDQPGRNQLYHSKRVTKSNQIYLVTFMRLTVDTTFIF